MTKPANAVSYDTVRRAAKRAGLIARKSRGRHPGYMLLNGGTRACVAGSQHELTAEEALTWIERLEARVRSVSPRPIGI